MTWQLILAAAGPLILTLALFGAMIARRRPPAGQATAGPSWADVLRQLLLAAPIRLWALILAGPPLTALVAWVVRLVRFGWPADRAQQQLEILGLTIYGLLGLLTVIVVSLAAVRLAAETKIGKLSIGRDDDDDDAPVSPPATGSLP